MKRVLVLTLFIFQTIVGGSFAESENTNVNYISAFSAHNKYQKNNAILIDVMPTVDYEKFHAAGAINLPNDGPSDIKKIEEMELPFSKNDEIIVYCG